MRTIVVLALGAAVVPAQAQRPDPFYSERGGPQRAGTETRFGFRQDAVGNIDDGGHVSDYRANAGVATRLPIGHELMLGLDVETDYASFAFHDADPDTFGSPGLMNDAVGVSVGPMLFGKINERWSWMAGGRLGFAGEPDADFGRAINPSLVGGLNRVYSDKFRLTLGFAAFNYEGFPLALVFPGIDWKASDQVTIRTTGPGVDIVTRLGPETALTVRGRWDYRQFRLADDEPSPGGKFYDQRVIFGLELSQRFFRFLELAIEGGTSIYHQMELRDDDNEKIASSDVDSALYGGLRLKARI